MTATTDPAIREAEARGARRAVKQGEWSRKFYRLLTGLPWVLVIVYANNSADRFAWLLGLAGILGALRSLWFGWSYPRELEEQRNEAA